MAILKTSWPVAPKKKEPKVMELAPQPQSVPTVVEAPKRTYKIVKPEPVVVEEEELTIEQILKNLEE